ncbi:hypothetical protein DSOUD_1808 [Desulfuromonas soudanensis]|uniref:Uncharacterized protein n=1 Tax=Desulfuromonas soudanensis TaxID=1603606 RepID=A0A0M3QFS6_9BACT|nr:hypothetical protein [Desulfuromonas soudanensis]ALC16583.1 hypothetical protein DSOUD_1808 [Desulfuromonas soudanensis]
MKGRTVREFPANADLWPQVEAWAAKNRFALDHQEVNRRVYRKGHWMLMAPAWVEIRREGQRAILEAWINADLFLILSLFSGKKSETGIESGGITAAVPRRKTREAVNRLLALFDQKPIV